MTETITSKPEAVANPEAGYSFSGYCTIEAVLSAQKVGTTIVDCREEPRFKGLKEPIDPVAGCIPTAVNRPWQGVTDEAGNILDEDAQRRYWGELLNAAQ